MRLAAIVFDFDGVILESVDLKARAFRRLFTAYPEQQDRIVRLHLEQGGLSRYEKLRRIYAEYLRLPLSDEEMARLDREFEALVAAEMATCRFVPGARAFIERRAAERPLFVASGTPQEELRRVVEQRGLSQYFVGVYGSPRRKPELLRAILEETRLEPPKVLLIGDSRPDYEAAAGTGVSFVGRVPAGQPNPFPPSVGVVVRDLYELERWWADGCTTTTSSTR